MANSNYTVQSVNLSNIFMAYISGHDKAPDTLYKYYDGSTSTYKDINNLFEKYTSGTKASITNIKYNGIDLCDIFQNNNTPLIEVTGGTILIDYTLENFGTYYLLKVFKTGVKLTTNTNVTIDYTLVGGGCSGGGASGTSVTAGLPGGGGGHIVNIYGLSMTNGNYIITTIGAGGLAPVEQPPFPPTGSGNLGANTYFTTNFLNTNTTNNGSYSGIGSQGYTNIAYGANRIVNGSGAVYYAGNNSYNAGGGGGGYLNTGSNRWYLLWRWWGWRRNCC